MYSFIRRYGTAGTLQFPLHEVGSSDLATGSTFVAGDVKLSKDGGALANVAALPAESPAGSGLYVLTLSAAELSAARVTVVIIDQTSPKDFDNRVLRIETYGNPAAQHPYDPGAAPTGITVEMTETRA